MQFARLRSLFPFHTHQYRELTSQKITWGHWFALLNIVLALLISTRYAFSADWPNTLFGKLYFFISLFGHFSFVVFAGYLLLIFPLSFLIKNERTFRGISVILATLGLTLLLVDTEAFRHFYLHLSPLMWDLLVNPDNGELARNWQLLFVPMPLILLAEMLYSRWCWQKLRSFNRQKWGKYVALFFLTCFTATHLIYAWADMTFYRPITAQKANYPLSYPMTARNFLEQHGLIDREEWQAKEIESGRADSFYLKYPKQTLKSHGFNPTNILVINLSGLNNEIISAENMPYLTQVADKSIRFHHHHNSGNNATAATVGLFYSLTGKYTDSILSEQKGSPWIQVMQQSGYQFGLFSHNGFDLPLYRHALFKGFTLPHSFGNLDAINQWQKWLNQRHSQKPFFSYLDLHLPFADTYAQQVKLADWQFKQIWQALRQHELTERTLIIINADSTNFSSETPFYKKKIQLPLLVYWQGQARNYTNLSSQLDIMPTVLNHFFGIINPLTDYAQGENLGSKHERPWVLASDRRWDIAILPDDEQYHIDKKGHFIKFDTNGNPEKNARPPLALFLQMLQKSNHFVEK